MQDRITVCLEDDDRSKIETRIKQEYPKLRNVSELVRHALKEFLDKDSNQPLKKTGEEPCKTASI
jgi:Arc/MetJ-type ribon-helix-helix transcriptional regulator